MDMPNVQNSWTNNCCYLWITRRALAQGCAWSTSGLLCESVHGWTLAAFSGTFRAFECIHVLELFHMAACVPLLMLGISPLDAQTLLSPCRRDGTGSTGFVENTHTIYSCPLLVYLVFLQRNCEEHPSQYVSSVSQATGSLCFVWNMVSPWSKTVRS